MYRIRKGRGMGRSSTIYNQLIYAALEKTARFGRDPFALLIVVLAILGTAHIDRQQYGSENLDFYNPLGRTHGPLWSSNFRLFS